MGDRRLYWRRAIACAALFAAGMPLAPMAQAATPPDPGPGCDPSRPAVAHLAGQQVLSPQPAEVPIPCGVRTGFPGGETRIEVTNTGAVIYAPAGAQSEPQTTVHGRGGIAVSHDQGATWERRLPLGMSWHQNDQETYVDRETGRLFWGVMQKNPVVQVPNDGNPEGDPEQSPGSHMYRLPEGDVDTDPDHAPAAAAFVTTSHILTSADDGETWDYGWTCCEIVNGAAILTADPPAGTEQPVGYPNVAYYCWRSSQTFLSRPPESICSRSLDGGDTWEIRGHMNRPVIPVHGEQCATPGSVTNTPAPESELVGLPVAADDGTLYALLICRNRSYLIASDDQALTWPVVRELTRPDGSPVIGELRIDEAGNLYVMRATRVAGQPDRLLLSMSGDEGATWTDELDVTAPGVTYLEQERPPHQGSISCCTNWFYDVRGEGHLVVAYSGRTADDGDRIHGYVTATRNAHDALRGRDPVFYSASVNPPSRPLKYFAGFPKGANGTTAPPGAINALGGPQTNQVGADIGPDGSPWVSFTEDCGPSPDTGDCPAQNGQTRGYAGRLQWPG